ncbi:hypothetical protein SAMN06269173_10178 [Hymenobacter mucosus]|uniref:Uncharacterized protein n=1 Tax=Hymenobacter mucosus TaxID=1411120 RepID=A0A238V475_9BACT|nr:hypothetical protein SAMN06269173_10178 [Hymenobacter mucosus]
MYQEHLALGRELLCHEGLQRFLGHVVEGHYYVSLWTALIALEFGRPVRNEVLHGPGRTPVVDMCLDIIRRHYVSHSHNLSDSQNDLVADWLAKIDARYEMAASSCSKPVS